MIVLLTILAAVFAASCAIHESTPEVIFVPAPSPATLPPMPSLTPEPTVVDSGLAYGIPCKPPCWQRLIPGKTTRAEAARVLQELLSSGLAEEIKDTDGTPDGSFIVLFPTESIAFVTFDGGVLTSILGSVDFDYTVGDVVGAFGSPEAISSQRGIGSGKCLACPESGTMAETAYDTQISFLYPNQGLVFEARIPPDLEGCICPKMKVRSFCYYVPQSMEDRLKNDRDLCVTHIWARTLAELAEWHGFGSGY